MLDCTLYYQPVEIYRANAYDENVIVFRNGNVGEARQDTNVFDHLMEKVEHYEYKNERLIIMTRDEHYERHADCDYDKRYVAKWKNDDPSTRPWRFSHEIANDE